MQEFSSVTASSYDAEALAPLLNDKAADGWSVVSIVAAGTNIVAYLQREADGQTADTAAPTDDTPVETVAETTADVPAIAAVADAPAADEPAAEPATDEQPAAVEEPAGWAAADEVATAATADPVEESIADLAAQAGGAEAATAVSEPVVAAVAPEPVAAAPAVESAVPAGWYADPSGRFELRYWDGTAWTEHVSRAGQQFTDPPVA